MESMNPDGDHLSSLLLTTLVTHRLCARPLSFLSLRSFSVSLHDVLFPLDKHTCKIQLNTADENFAEHGVIPTFFWLA